MSLVLKTSNLSKKYKDVFAVDSDCININRGEIYGLVGQNGAGKTTVMKMIAGLIRPSGGQLELFGSTALNCQRAKIGYIIETPSLYSTMTARQNLDVMLSLLPGNPRFSINSVLDIVGLQGTGSKKVSQFSHGMKQRLGIAMSLIGSPEFLILDEPINGLDPIGMNEFRGIIHRLNREYGLTILISSHILSELFKLVTCYGVIAGGKLVAELSDTDIKAFSLDDKSLENYIVKLMGGYDDVKVVEL